MTTLKRTYVFLSGGAAFYSTEDYDGLLGKVIIARTHGMGALVETEMVVFNDEEQTWQPMPGSFDATRLIEINAVPIDMAVPPEQT